VDLKALSSSVEALLEAQPKGWVAACHDISDGGMAVAMAEMCIGGQLGMNVDISSLDRMRPAALLFSESNTRWLIEVPGAKGRSVEALFKRHGVALTKMGTVKAPKTSRTSKARLKGKGRAKQVPEVTNPARLTIRSGKRVLVDIAVSELEDAWNRPFWEFMG
jgi:phosphoribosylformylglycinamidine synthase